MLTFLDDVTNVSHRARKTPLLLLTTRQGKMVTTRRKAAEEAIAAASPAPKSDRAQPSTSPSKATKQRDVNGWAGTGTGAGVRGATTAQSIFYHLGVVALIVLTPPAVIVL